MKKVKSISDMLHDKTIFVPDYQRSYSWDTPRQKFYGKTHVDVFLNDVIEYVTSSSSSNYYLGHFIFENRNNKTYAIIDGQQRLTTIIILISSIYYILKDIYGIENEYKIFLNSFSTVDYDDQFFKDYVITRTKKSQRKFSTVSEERIKLAFDYFTKVLKKLNKCELEKIANSLMNASCTAHVVRQESESIQMFIFQNNRGKLPSNLEIIKALFMYNVHLRATNDTDAINKEIKNRFEKIYKSIAEIEYNINEDDILLYTLRVYFNSLSEHITVDILQKKLLEKESINFILDFTRTLEENFSFLSVFFGEDNRKYIEIHSLVTLGGLATAIPFVLKAYKLQIDMNELRRLCIALESLVLRHRLIGTRAEMSTRINDVFTAFIAENPTIEPILAQVANLKTSENWWWAHWNNAALENAIQGKIQPETARFLLWKYENHLKGKGKSGYAPMRFDQITNPELEHIAPQTPPNNEKLASGYFSYDDDDAIDHIECLGNYLLISKSHNCSVGNSPFKDKLATYKHLDQQREICVLAKGRKTWGKQLIKKRKKLLADFILATF